MMDCVQFISQNGKDFWSTSPNPPSWKTGWNDWNKEYWKWWYECAYPRREYSPTFRGIGYKIVAKEKKDTLWYDDVVILYQKLKETEPPVATALRNILWDQVKLLLYARVRDFINEKKSAILKRDPELCQQLYQDAFFIFQKACDIWNPVHTRRTKFITFLGDITDQDILNVIRLDLYHKNRDRKIYKRMSDNFEGTFPDNGDRGKLVEEVKHLFENFIFNSELERTMVRTIMYGKKGDWPKVLKKSKMSYSKFYRLKRGLIARLKSYLFDNCSPYMKETLEEMICEKKGVRRNGRNT